MLFRHMFDSVSCTYTYVLASGIGREAYIIDPVKEHTDRYLQLIFELQLRLVIAIDTHTHADHITALGSLRESSGCRTVMGEHTKAECISYRVRDSEGTRAVFTGDSLLIRGTGRTDLRGGDPHQSYGSIVDRLFTLPDETHVYPAHDYRGCTSSTIGEERMYNPRLANHDESAYVDLMRNLKLSPPMQMDVAVAANLACGESVKDTQ
jgi:glyoxylase-like metal-dependent hydrolase (beta-lactamase superfamily II)